MEPVKGLHVSPALNPTYQGSGSNKYTYNSYPSTQPHSQHNESPKRPVQMLKTTIEVCNFYCTFCSLPFQDHVEFEHHNMEMHGHRKILTCNICTATFRRQDHLKRHMQSLHFNQKYCVCPVCGKDYKRQDILLKHIKKKHATDAEVFHCRECEFECRSHTELEKHEHMHLLTDRHVCQHCNASFKRRDHMLRHVKSQHLNQSIVCPICQQSYKRKDHVVRHVREKHKMGYLNGKLVTSSDMV